MTDLYAEFRKFDGANPGVWLLFKDFTLAAIKAGRKTYSADAILHRIRWHTEIETTGPVYKINDHFSAYYARKFLNFYPEREGFFITRALREERAQVAA